MNAEILSIGDELLIGQVVNTNAAWLGRELAGMGLHVTRTTCIGDARQAIVAGFRECLGRTSWLFTTGGLGPTKDDVTRHALQEVFGGEMVFSELVWDQLHKIYAIIGKPVTEDMRDQCYFPSSARILPNYMGTAPGLFFESQGYKVCIMPGVPFEMEHLMNTQFAPLILSSNGDQKITMRTLATVGEGESALARRIADIEAGLPQGLGIAYLPSLGRVRVRVTGIGDRESDIAARVDEISSLIADRIEDVLYARKDISLAAAIGELLRARGLTVSVAESCTGGFLSHLFTSIAGSSDYFVGGGITYSNALKESVLGVTPKTLESHGAVSEETALEMASGARKRFNSDYAIAVSGIAGPGGGSVEKPVGTVWIAIADAHGTIAQKRVFGKDRLRNIELSAVYALDMLRKRIG